jgi:RNA polymerase sigma-70 factor (ECF subfamily)
VTQPAANSLIVLRLPELTAVAEGQTKEATTSIIVSLTRRLAAGEDEAFRQFQGLYFDRLYRFLLVIARGDETQARDALQETLMRVARHARAFEEEEAFWNWLKSIGRNAARDAARSRRRYLSLLERFTRSGEAEVRPVRTDEALAAALEGSVGELDAADRNLIEGKYLDGQTVKELAARTGLSEKAVESKLLRLRRQLREGILRKLNTS